MSEPGTDTLTYLDRATVAALLPDLPEQLDLLEGVYRAMAGGRVELPPKLGVHPREDSFLHAMPAYLADRDVVAVKWVAAYPGNRDAGLPSVTGLLVLNDAATGLPRAVLDAGELTAVRTAVASGVAVRRLAHPGWSSAAVLGYGEQGRHHVRVLAGLNPEAEIRVYSPRLHEPVPDLRVTDTAREAVDGADVVVTCAPMTAAPAPVLDRDWVPGRCLVVPVDFDAYVTPGLVRAADLLVVDDVRQYQAYRARGSFPGWPEAGASLGETLGPGPGPEGDLRVACNLGVGAVDAALAAVVLDRAGAVGAGVPLPR